MPSGWEDRLVTVETEATGGGRGLCLEVHDLASSKIAAGREKDLEFVDAMLFHGLTSVAMLRARIRDTSALTPESRRVVQQWLDAREQKPI